MRWLLAWLALLAALVAAPVQAQLALPARPAGAVWDGANILAPVDEQLLSARLAEYNRRTGRALVVATVPSLQQTTVEDYAVRLYEAWGIGGAQSDAGVLLLVAPAERKVRIEVGYGLHQYVTDILSGRIVRDRITPRFKAGDYAGGINAGIDDLITQLDRDPADATAIAEAAAAAQRSEGQGGESFASAIGPILMILFFMFAFGRRGGRSRERRGMAGAVGDVILWNAIGSAMGGSSRGGGGFGGGGGGGFGGFGGGMSGGGGASGSW